MTDYTERAREWLEGKECPWPISVEGWSTGTLHALTTLLVSVAAEAREQQRKEEAVMTCYATGDARPCSLFPDLCKCNIPTSKESLHVQEAVMTLNERIAEVKGWKRTDDPLVFLDEDGMAREPNWSGLVEHAWELVEGIPAGEGLGATRLEWDGEDWVCILGRGKARCATTAPEAICLAYLAVMEGKS